MFVYSRIFDEAGDRGRQGNRKEAFEIVQVRDGKDLNEDSRGKMGKKSKEETMGMESSSAMATD